MDKEKKARELVNKGFVEFRGLIGSSLYFYVKSISGKKHEVIYRIPTNKWLCDCAYFSVKAKECSHILACKIWLKNKDIKDLINKQEKMQQ